MELSGGCQTYGTGSSHQLTISFLVRGRGGVALVCLGKDARLQNPQLVSGHHAGAQGTWRCGSDAGMSCPSHHCTKSEHDPKVALHLASSCGNRRVRKPSLFLSQRGHYLFARTSNILESKRSVFRLQPRQRLLGQETSGNCALLLSPPISSCALSNGSSLPSEGLTPCPGAPAGTADAGGLRITLLLFWLHPHHSLPPGDGTARGQAPPKAQGRKGSYHCAFQTSPAQSSPSLKDGLV